MELYLPIDAIAPPPIDVDVTADYIELTAFFADSRTAPTSDLANALSLGAAEDPRNRPLHVRDLQEEVVSSAVARIQARGRMLGSAYPFSLDDNGDVLTCELNEESFGHSAYLLSLVLSHLRSVSPILTSSGLHPNSGEVRRLREYFQYVATAALAGEVRGEAWSFGFPRPDATGFFKKLRQIWQRLGDGIVGRQAGAPTSPKDDQIDVFAARLHPDGLPGFPLAAAQVATGKNARNKSLKGHLPVFKGRWFSRQPVTEWMPYMIVPFAIEDDQFRDDVLTMGNVLHRLRVPRRVAEACHLVEAGVQIEGYCQLPNLARWIAAYRDRAREAA